MLNLINVKNTTVLVKLFEEDGSHFIKAFGYESITCRELRNSMSQEDLSNAINFAAQKAAERELCEFNTIEKNVKSTSKITATYRGEDETIFIVDCQVSF